MKSGAAIIVAIILLLTLFWKKLFPGTTPNVSSTVGGVPVPASATGAMAAATSNPIPIYQSPYEKFTPAPAPAVIGSDVASVQAVTAFPFAYNSGANGLSPEDNAAIQESSYNGGIMPVYS